MSTSSLTAGEVMDRAASLLNDTAKTDYTYVAQLPYLNMAIDELVESLQESNSSPTNRLSEATIILPVGSNALVAVESPTSPALFPRYPADLIEIQEICERTAGTQDSFIRMGRKEWIEPFPPNNSLLVWSWLSQIIKFNPRGALTTREILLKYVAGALNTATDENTILHILNARSYLSYKTAAFCAFFIGENESRAKVLDDLATDALDRLIGINNKGRQQFMTRHRPFRAAYKARGGSY